MQNLFSSFTDNLLTAISLNQSQNVTQNIDEQHDIRASTSGYSPDDIPLCQFDMFSDDENTVNDQEPNENEDFELPDIFEDSDKYGTEVDESMAKIVDSVIRKKADVSALVKRDDNKIPVNCKGLSPAAINPEIWQKLDRRARGQDLIFQTVQKLLGLGIVPVLRIANLLRNKNLDPKLFKELASRAIAILCNTFF